MVRLSGSAARGGWGLDSQDPSKALPGSPSSLGSEAPPLPSGARPTLWTWVPFGLRVSLGSRPWAEGLSPLGDLCPLPDQPSPFPPLSVLPHTLNFFCPPSPNFSHPSARLLPSAQPIRGQNTRLGPAPSLPAPNPRRGVGLGGASPPSRAGDGSAPGAALREGAGPGRRGRGRGRAGRRLRRV